MSQTVTVSRHVRCPVDEASAFVTDPHKLLSNMSTLSRCRFIESTETGELWDVYVDSGTVHLGGRVLVTPPTDFQASRLHWKSVRGTRHSFDARVEPDGDGTRLTLADRHKCGLQGCHFRCPPDQDWTCPASAHLKNQHRTRV